MTCLPDMVLPHNLCTPFPACRVLTVQDVGRGKDGSVLLGKPVALLLGLGYGLQLFTLLDKFLDKKT